jgi:hypothetical protein
VFSGVDEFAQGCEGDSASCGAEDSIRRHSLEGSYGCKYAIKSEVKQLVRERKMGLHCSNVQLSNNEEAKRKSVSKNRDPELNQEAIRIFDTAKTDRVRGRL